MDSLRLLASVSHLQAQTAATDLESVAPKRENTTQKRNGWLCPLNVCRGRSFGASFRSKLDQRFSERRECPLPG
jgi:hypothetical protein